MNTQTLTTITFAIAGVLGSWTSALATESIEVSEKAAAVGMLPYQKRGDTLDKDERNPFAVRVEKKQNVSTTDGTTEESKLRGRLNQMRVQGISRGEGGYRAQVGGLILEEGRMVPQLIANQTDVLKVSKVSEKTVEITWVNEEGAEEPRKHILALDIRPMVRSALPAAGGMAPMDPRIPVGYQPKREMLAEGETPVTPAD